MTSWYEKQSYIDRYSWFITGEVKAGGDGKYFVAPTCSLLDGQGALTNLGKSYFA